MAKLEERVMTKEAILLNREMPGDAHRLVHGVSKHENWVTFSYVAVL